jgi:hypothetical protein
MTAECGLLRRESGLLTLAIFGALQLNCFGTIDILPREASSLSSLCPTMRSATGILGGSCATKKERVRVRLMKGYGGRVSDGEIWIGDPESWQGVYLETWPEEG